MLVLRMIFVVMIETWAMQLKLIFADFVVAGPQPSTM